MVGVGALIFLAGIVGLVKPSLLRLPGRKWAAGLLVAGFVLVGAAGSGGESNDLATEEAASEETESKFTVDETTARQFFYALAAAQARAMKEADSQFTTDILDPAYRQENVSLNSKRWSELTSLYEAEVRAEYGISDEEAGWISDRGIRDGWPRPEPQ